MSIVNEPKLILYSWYLECKNSGGVNFIKHFVKEINRLSTSSKLYVFLDFYPENIVKPTKINKLYTYDLEKYLDLYYDKMKNMEEVNYPIATKDMLFDKNNIIIYPELNGNPLNFVKIVRFNLYFNINVLDPNEYIIYYVESFKRLENYVKQINNRKISNIQNPICPYYVKYIYDLKNILKYCKNLNLKRDNFCYDTRKGDFRHFPRIKKKESNYQYHPENSYKLALPNNEDPLKYHCRIFNIYKFFYCYDPFTFLLPMAALCGCIPIVIPLDGINSINELYDEEWMKYGIAYGNSPEQINRAIETREKLRTVLHNQLCNQNSRDFLKIILSIKNHFKNKQIEINNKDLFNQKCYFNLKNNHKNNHIKKFNYLKEYCLKNINSKKRNIFYNIFDLDKTFRKILKKNSKTIMNNLFNKEQFKIKKKKCYILYNNNTKTNVWINKTQYDRKSKNDYKIIIFLQEGSDNNKLLLRKNNNENIISLIPSYGDIFIINTKIDYNIILNNINKQKLFAIELNVILKS